MNDLGEVVINLLIGSYVDKDIDMFVYKEILVKMEILKYDGISLLFKINYCNGNLQL